MSANILINIEPQKDYSNENIYAIHCTKTNECQVIINGIVFPFRSFVQGAVYYINIETINFDSNKAGFIGYKKNNLYS